MNAQDNAERAKGVNGNGNDDHQACKLKFKCSSLLGRVRFLHKSIIARADKKSNPFVKGIW